VIGSSLKLKGCLRQISKPTGISAFSLYSVWVLAYNDKAKGLRGWRGRRKENGPDPNGVLGFEPLFKWVGTEREM